MGIGRFDRPRGRFDLILSVRYDASVVGPDGVSDLDAWEAAFAHASRLLYDATDGQHQFGTIYVYNDDGNTTRDTADAYLMPPDDTDDTNDTSESTGKAVLGTPNEHMILRHDERLKPFIIVHEFGHYVYGLWDENLDCLQIPGAHCIGGGDASACIMEADWTRGDKIELKNDGTWGLVNEPGLVKVSEFCTNDPDFDYLSVDCGSPGEEGPAQGYHSCDNLQQRDHHQSCWETMVLAVATNDTSHTFDLQAPAPPEYADYLPEDQTDRNEAAAINWIVLGRQQRFALVLDRSGSMTGDKLDKSKEGAYFWADAATTGDHIGVVSYADDVTVCPPTALGPPFMYVISDDTDGDAVQAAIDPISARGLTAIGDALRAGLEQIQADTLVGPVKGQDVIALVTDGYHNTGEDPSDVLDELIDYGVQVYTVGIGSSIHEPLLHDIASRTGGKFYRIDLGATENGAADQIKNSLIEIEEIAHGGGLVSYTSGSTNPGPVPESAYIEPGSKMATFTLSWDNPEHGFSLKLVAPNDEEITKDSLPANVRLVYSERTYMGFQVSNPGAFSSGDSDARWKLYVIPEHGTGRANYHLFVFSRNPHIHGGIASPSRLCQPGMSTPVHFHCCYDYPLTGLNVTGEVLLPNGKSRTLKFKDDGDMESGDVLGGDGLYSAILHETGKPGLYTIKVTVDSDGKSVRYGSRTGQPSDEEEDGSPPIPRFYRQFTRTVGVGEVPFKDVKPEPNSGYPGETLQVTLKGESTHFRQGDTTAGFGEGIQVGEIEVVDKHTARVAIAIAKDARLGLRDVTVATARYRETIEVEGGFQVVPHRCGCSVILARLWKLLRAIWQGLAFIDDVELTEERRDRNPRA